jgi:pilus assembly protein Flp/PilA
MFMVQAAKHNENRFRYGKPRKTDMIFKRLLEDRKGATAVEYGLISAVMAVFLLSGFSAFSNALNNQFNYLASVINY